MVSKIGADKAKIVFLESEIERLKEKLDAAETENAEFNRGPVVRFFGRWTRLIRLIHLDAQELRKKIISGR